MTFDSLGKSSRHSTSVFDDNYALDRRLAAQIESEWGDVLLGDFVADANPAARRLGVANFRIRQSYYRDLSEWVTALVPPQTCRRVVDVGAALGRFIVEFLRRSPQIESARYVEPSPRLFSWAGRILSAPPGDVASIPFLSGLSVVRWHEGPVSAGVEARIRDRIQLLEGTVDAVSLGDASFDLATAFNVLDQCAYPSRVAESVMKLAKPGGYVALSCTHQFQQRLYVDATTLFDSLHDLFPAREWRLVAETELPFESRMGERHCNRFLSHHVLYRRAPC